MNIVKSLKVVPFALAALLLSACSTVHVSTGGVDAPAGTTDRNQAALDVQAHRATHAAPVADKEPA